MVQMLLHPWLYLAAQMLYATLLLRCCWSLCKAQMFSCLFWLHRCYMQFYCPDAIEHCVRHRCSHACFLLSVSGTMLMCLICGQDVVRPIFFYFIFSSGMLNSKLSQMCGRLYFPIFLLSVGLFILIYIDSLIVLAKLLSSLPIILKFSIDVSWPLILWCWNIGEGAFKCSLNLSPNVLPDSPMYSSPQSMLPQE